MPLLARGADHEVGLGHVGRAQARRAARPRRHRRRRRRRGRASGGLHELGAPAVVEADPEREGRIHRVSRSVSSISCLIEGEQRSRRPTKRTRTPMRPMSGNSRLIVSASRSSSPRTSSSGRFQFSVENAKTASESTPRSRRASTVRRSAACPRCGRPAPAARAARPARVAVHDDGHRARDLGSGLEGSLGPFRADAAAQALPSWRLRRPRAVPRPRGSRLPCPSARRRCASRAHRSASARAPRRGAPRRPAPRRRGRDP